MKNAVVDVEKKVVMVDTPQRVVMREVDIECFIGRGTGGVFW